jgi:hypothetical protein
MNAPVKPADTRNDRGFRATVVLCAAVIVLTALYFISTVFAPLAFAMLIIAVMWPLQARLQARLPKLVALFLTMVATVVIFAAFVSLRLLRPTLTHEDSQIHSGSACSGSACSGSARMTAESSCTRRPRTATRSGSRSLSLPSGLTASVWM